MSSLFHKKIQSIVCCIMCRIFFNTMARIFLLVRLATKEISVPYIDFNENVRSMHNITFLIPVIYFYILPHYWMIRWIAIVNFTREFNKILNYMTSIMVWNQKGLLIKSSFVESLFCRIYYNLKLLCKLQSAQDKNFYLSAYSLPIIIRRGRHEEY